METTEGVKIIVSLADLKRLIASGESETLELKRSPDELGRAGESPWGFLTRAGRCLHEPPWALCLSRGGWALETRG